MSPARRAHAWIGTSGWLYPHWRGSYYPPGLPQKGELGYLAQRLPTVEVNGTFYSLTRPSTCESWRAAVPAGFVFAIKGSRYITHMLKLKNFENALANFLSSGILRLGATLGPILWQLPPQLRFAAESARAFIAALPRSVREAERRARGHDERTKGRAALTAPDGRGQAVRHAFEIRHPSWLCDTALEMFRAAGVALVNAETAGRFPLSLERTAPFAYVRLHGSAELYASRYRDDELAGWADRIGGWMSQGSDVYVYFDNDARAHAPNDAQRLANLLEARKLNLAGRRSGDQVRRLPMVDQDDSRPMPAPAPSAPP